MSWLDTKPADVVADAVAQLASAEDAGAESIRSYAGEDLRFGVWLHLVDKRCRTILGLSIFDLEDWNWRDAYAGGSSPKEAFGDFREDLGLEDE